ncbi:endonuclease/exonuclease/phosphatase family protein [Serinibacter arcticus]|uniref:Endonuclease/exonuclease/phosphatase domain-containing protein n=1 Tax=Serinibacter arcticus TaxID=1655435 RepID=A0A4Z1E8J3_9MICO|nr:endonuclease/exonuclease/phosphatase family protein [Serinibacter arcticus]TGO05887.1 hypothetical protein SERN_0079 [Serinibacter arcticus]
MATTIRLLTWNVLGLREPSRVAAVVRRARADVVCLQECPRWPGGRAALALFASATGLRLAAGGGSRGVAVLVRPGVEVTAGRVEAMPRRFVGAWFTYPRATATASLVVEGRPVTVSSVHLDVWEPGRLAHVDRILAGLQDGDPGAAHVVAGDLNEGPDGESWARLTATLSDAAADGGPTYPATATRRPRSRLDAVLLGGPVAAVDHRTGPDRSGLPSDHLPVLVTLELRDPAGQPDPQSRRSGGSDGWTDRWGAPPAGA